MNLGFVLLLSQLGLFERNNNTLYKYKSIICRRAIRANSVTVRNSVDGFEESIYHFAVY